MEQNEVMTEKSISLGTFWKVFRKYWILLVAASLVVAIGVGVASWLLYTPLWSSTATFYVSNVADTTYLFSNGQTAGAKDMVANCESFLRGSVVLDQVLEKLDQPKTPENRAYLNKMISVHVPTNTATFTVTVTHTNQELTPQVIQAIEEILPIACDSFNNQDKLSAVAGEGTLGDVVNPSQGTDSVTPPAADEDKSGSMMLKVVDNGVKDLTPDNRSDLIKRPMLAAGVTFVLLYLLLLLIVFTDRTVYSKDDLYEKLPQNIPVYGMIPHWSSDRAKSSKPTRNMTKKQRMRRLNVEELLLDRPEIPFDVEESFHQLCTNVTFLSTGERGCTLGVLSATAASGKSFIMANLAVALSRRIDKKVLLIDADMRCPMIHKIFRKKNNAGLSNLLAGQIADANSVIHHVGSLDVITSGTIPPNPIELLSSPNMEKLIAQWKQEYDFVLIDLPPVGEVSDAAAVSTMVSGYLFVVRSGISDSRTVRECCETMAARQAKIYGYVLNDVLSVHMGKSAGYYHNGYYRSSVKKEAEAADAQATEN